MIRSALIALGLSASGLGGGAVSAQGMIPAAPIVDSCGGTRLVLEAVDGADDLGPVSDIVSARLAAAFSAVYDYTDVVDTQIVVSLPDVIETDVARVEQVLGRSEFGFHDVIARIDTGVSADPKDGQIVLPHVDSSGESYVLAATPVLDGTFIAMARLDFDYNGLPAVAFQFTPDGTQLFADYTAANIGQPFAIVVDGQVMTAPTIQSAILGGEGIITGNFTVEEATEMAMTLQGGVLPFDLVILDAIPVDGSDPSADFCP